MFTFLVDHLEKFWFDLCRRHIERIEFSMGRKTCEKMEKPCCIVIECNFCGKVAHIGIDFGGAWIVISCCKMQIAFEFGSSALDHLGNFGMYLQARNAINDMGAGIFEGFCPDKVVLFIKTCFELYKYSDLFAIPDGIDERFDYG